MVITILELIISGSENNGVTLLLEAWRERMGYTDRFE